VSGGNIENLSNSIFFYPNLAKDKITVSFYYKGGETEFTYKIYSLSEQMVSGGITRHCFESLSSFSRNICVFNWFFLTKKRPERAFLINHFK